MIPMAKKEVGERYQSNSFDMWKKNLWPSTSVSQT